MSSSSLVNNAYLNRVILNRARILNLQADDTNQFQTSVTYILKIQNANIRNKKLNFKKSNIENSYKVTGNDIKSNVNVDDITKNKSYNALVVDKNLKNTKTKLIINEDNQDTVNVDIDYNNYSGDLQLTIPGVDDNTDSNDDEQQLLYINTEGGTYEVNISTNTSTLIFSEARVFYGIYEDQIYLTGGSMDFNQGQLYRLYNDNESKLLTSKYDVTNFTTVNILNDYIITGGILSSDAYSSTFAVKKNGSDPISLYVEFSVYASCVVGNILILAGGGDIDPDTRRESGGQIRYILNNKVSEISFVDFPSDSGSIRTMDGNDNIIIFELKGKVYYFNSQNITYTDTVQVTKFSKEFVYVNCIVYNNTFDNFVIVAREKGQNVGIYTITYSDDNTPTLTKIYNNDDNYYLTWAAYTGNNRWSIPLTETIFNPDKSLSYILKLLHLTKTENTVQWSPKISIIDKNFKESIIISSFSNQ